MNLDFFHKVLPKLSVEELQEIKTRIDFLLSNKKIRKPSSTEELLWKELVARYNAPPIEKAGKSIITLIKKTALFIDNESIRLELNNFQKKRLCRVLISSVEFTLKAKKESPSTFIVAQYMTYANDILRQSYPGYYGTSLFKSMVLNSTMF